MNFKLALILLIVPFVLALDSGRAQNPMVIVQAASPAPVVATPPTSAPTPTESNSATIKLLQDMRATNAETLKKQQAVLEQLDDLAKAAEQMKAFSKRG